MDVDALHRDLLLALATVAIERFKQRGIGAGKLVRLGEALPSALEGLFADHGAPVALHRGVVGGDQAASAWAGQDRVQVRQEANRLEAIIIALRRLVAGVGSRARNE
jgi:hypothetical protein